MAKHFKRFPKDLTYYNPTKLKIDESLTSGTRDDSKRLHSFNDEPSLLEITTKRRTISWHNHGVLTRDKTKPCKVYFGDEFYETFNENSNLHSYNDKPASISTYTEGQSYSLEWRQDNLFHRENDLPARLFYESGFVSNQFYFMDGQAHRSYSQPAAISSEVKAWFVRGELHNKNGKAFINLSSRMISESKYGLYGVELPLKTFKKIKETELDKNVPLWAAFLFALNMLNDEHMKVLNLQEKNWDYSLPIAWQLRTLKVTNQSFIEAISEQSREDRRIKFRTKKSFNSSKLDALINVIKSEDEDTRVKLAEKMVLTDG